MWRRFLELLLGAGAEFAFRRIDEVTVRGRAMPTVIYTLDP